MPYLTVQELNALWGLEREWLERSRDRINEEIESSTKLSKAEGLDARLVARAMVPMLLVLAAQLVLRYCPDEDRASIEHYFLRCAAEAMLSSLGLTSSDNSTAGN